MGDVTCPPQRIGGTTGLEPTASDVTGASASSLFSWKYAFLQWVTGDNERHVPTRNDPFSQLLVTQLLTQLKSARGGRSLNHCRRNEIAHLLIRNQQVASSIPAGGSIYVV